MYSPISVNNVFSVNCHWSRINCGKSIGAWSHSNIVFDSAKKQKKKNTIKQTTLYLIPLINWKTRRVH